MPNPNEIDPLALADRIIDRTTGESDRRAAVDRLCRICAGDDPQLARAGVAALFPGLVERLNDSFHPAACALYDQIFAQIIDFHRRLPEAQRLDEGLRRFGILTESDLLTRKARLLQPQTVDPDSLQRIKKVMLLSRVTIGADVAVTSVLIARLRDLLPEAEFVLVGSRKLWELYGGDQRVWIRELAYERGGTLLSRLTSWLDVVEAVAGEQAGVKPNETRPDEILVIDPDSRLTQLGLLPLLTDDRSYFFFESRGFRRDGLSRIGQLASAWADEIFGPGGDGFPFVALPDRFQAIGQALGEGLRRAGAAHIVTISLGVGGNALKRISDSFEESLILQLLADSTIILDQGASIEERAQVDRIKAALQEQGKNVIEANEQNFPELVKQEKIEADVVTWEGGIGSFAAMIATSDEYVGYDSAGQHIAAALGVPCLTIFVNSNSPAFAERWRPYGPGMIRVLNLEAAELPTTSEVLFGTLALYQKIRNKQD